MLIIEKNEIYEKIKEKEKKIKSFDKSSFVLIFYSLLYIVFYIDFFTVYLNYEMTLDFFYLSAVLIFLMYFCFRSIRLFYKSCKYVEYGQKELNKIYETDVFLKISEELILLDENNNISLINKDLINEILEFKKEKIKMTENLKILKTVAQEIENT